MLFEESFLEAEVRAYTFSSANSFVGSSFSLKQFETIESSATEISLAILGTRIGCKSWIFKVWDLENQIYYLTWLCPIDVTIQLPMEGGTLNSLMSAVAKTTRIITYNLKQSD